MSSRLEDTRKLLRESTALLVQSLPGRPDEDAFVHFRTGVVRASNTCHVSPEELLEDLGPKSEVLRYLIDLHEQKRLKHRQIAEVATILLQVGGWQAALREDAALCARLPDNFCAASPTASAEESGCAVERAPACGSPPAGPRCAHDCGIPTDGAASNCYALANASEGEFELECAFLAGEHTPAAAAALASSAGVSAATRSAQASQAPQSAAELGRAANAALEEDEYTICLSKRSGAMVGLSCSEEHFIVDIVAGSLIAHWNAANPQTQARAGDVLVEVNGNRGDVRAMRTAMQQDHKLTLKLLRAEAAAKGRWMYADTWCRALARRNPARWSEEMPKKVLLKGLAARAPRDRARPVVVEIAGECFTCSTEEQVRLLFSSGKALAPRRHFDAAGRLRGGSQPELLAAKRSEEEALQVAEDAVRADPAHIICEVISRFPNSWSVKCFTDADDFQFEVGTRHLVYSDAFVNKVMLRE